MQVRTDLTVHTCRQRYLYVKKNLVLMSKCIVGIFIIEGRSLGPRTNTRQIMIGL